MLVCINYVLVNRLNTLMTHAAVKGLARKWFIPHSIASDAVYMYKYICVLL